MSRYAIGPGRVILRDGVPLVTLHRVAHMALGEHTLSPFEADEFARHVVASLNFEDEHRCKCRRCGGVPMDGAPKSNDPCRYHMKEPCE